MPSFSEHFKNLGKFDKKNELLRGVHSSHQGLEQISWRSEADHRKLVDD